MIAFLAFVATVAVVVPVLLKAGLRRSAYIEVIDSNSEGT